jgi:hypothetical protein
VKPRQINLCKHHVKRARETLPFFLFWKRQLK